MRHLAFLRVYLPLESLHPRIHGLAEAATKLTRADIEAEAAQRLHLRLRPDTFSVAPRSSEPPIIRVIQAADDHGVTLQYFHVDYLERAAFESTQIRREFYHDEVYDKLVPEETLATLEKISELQADAGLISRPVPTFNMQLWNVPLEWLAAFLGPAEHTRDSRTVTESVVHGTPVIRRTRDLFQVHRYLGTLSTWLQHYGPDGPQHPHARGVANLHRWLSSFDTRQFHRAYLELDYGALSRYAWPDLAGKTLENGYGVLQRMLRLEQELEDDDDALTRALPPAMLKQAADIMRKQYETAMDMWKRISRYENAN